VGDIEGEANGIPRGGTTYWKAQLASLLDREIGALDLDIWYLNRGKR